MDLPIISKLSMLSISTSSGEDVQIVAGWQRRPSFLLVLALIKTGLETLVFIKNRHHKIRPSSRISHKSLRGLLREKAAFSPVRKRNKRFDFSYFLFKVATRKREKNTRAKMLKLSLKGTFHWLKSPHNIIERATPKSFQAEIAATTVGLLFGVVMSPIQARETAGITENCIPSRKEVRQVENMLL